MQLRYRLALPLAAICCLAFVVAPALAAKPVPTLVTQPDGSLQPPVAEISSAAVACQMGVLPPPAVAFGIILPPADQYYTLLDPRQCPACHADGRLLTLSHMLLYFTEACQINVTVAVTIANNDGAGCYSPNPFAPPLCAPVQYTINDAGYLNQCVDYQLPISAGCCINQPVFLLWQFDGPTNCPAGRPAVCGPGSCLNCIQYNYYPGAPFPGDDLCATYSPSGIFGIDHWVDSECCSPTETLPGSWGSLKTLYR